MFFIHRYLQPAAETSEGAVFRPLAEFSGLPEALLNAMPGGVICLSPQLDVVCWNDAAAGMLGRYQLKPQPISYYFPAADLYLDLENLGDQNHTQKTLNCSSYIRRGDNALAPVSLSCQTFCYGDESLIMMHFQDISEQESEKRALKAQQAIHNAIIDNNVNAIVLIDEHDRVQEFNIAACQMFGYLKEEVLNRRLSELVIPEEARAFHLAGIEEYRDKGIGNFINRRVEVVAQRKDGERFPVELTLFPLHMSGQTFFSAEIQDITERRASMKALQEAKNFAERANQYKSQFVASMSHEIRTPLNAVLGLLGLLQDSELDDDQHHFVKTAMNSGQGLLTILNDVLDLSKIEVGKIELEPDDFSPLDLAYGVADLLTNRVAEKGVILACYVDPRIPELLVGDSGRLRQVLMNLVGNSVKFTDQGSVVLRIDMIEKHSQHVRLLFSVEDTGIGISAGDREKLFDEFVQLDNQDNRRFGGTGLGLSISRKLISLMHGEINLRSTPGRGSTFSFELELPVSRQSGRLSQPLVTNTALSDKTVAVWLAHDKPAMILKEKLLTLGAVVHAIDSVAAYARLVSEDLPDLLVLEQRALAGEEKQILRQLKAVSDRVGAVLLTDLENRNDVRHWIAAGFNAVICSNSSSLKIAKTFRTAMTGIDQECYESRVQADRPRDLDIPFRILLAEDSQANQLVASNILRNAGYTVDVVGNGVEAISAVKSLPYDLVLMDLQMPEMDGISATRAIRELEKPLADIPVLAMTANVITDVKRQCLAVGMQGFIAKPIVREELFSELARWVEKKGDNNLPQPPASGLAEVGGDEAAGSQVDVVICAATLERLIADTSQATVSRMIGVFMLETRKRLDIIRAGLETADLKQIGAEAHTLKSSAASYGAVRMAEMARQTEADCRRGCLNPEQIHQLIVVGEHTIEALQAHPLGRGS